MNRDSKIYVAGHAGLVGSAICRSLERGGFTNLVTVERSRLDLRVQSDVEDWFSEAKPDYLFLAAAKVGGILANATYPADFIRDNLLIQTSLIDAAHRFRAERLLFLGSSCIYPRLAGQPMKEEYLLTGPLEATNEAYAIAKIAGIRMCQAYRRQHGFDSICLMPTNLYGPGDNFDLDSSHVIPALIRKFEEARASGSDSVTIWGSGKPRREFLHVDDLADACVFLMGMAGDRLDEVAPDRLINVGTGDDLEIRELAETIRGIVYPQAKLQFDASKPDGTPRKLLDVSRMRSLGWKAKTGLEEGLRSTYDWYRNLK